MRRVALAGALLFGGSAPALAQVTAAPESLHVTLRPGEEATDAFTLTNGGSTPVRYCLDFVSPLQRRREVRQGGSTCGEPGVWLSSFDESDLGHFWTPHYFTTTPDGRLFITEGHGLDSTFVFEVERELGSTAGLRLVGRFKHPKVGDLVPFPRAYGVTYNEDTGTLWWTNSETTGIETRRVLLLEGDLDGVPTGRRIELPIVPTAPDPFPNGSPAGAVYDPATERFYYVDAYNNDLWAVDTLGNVEPGYPVRLERYPEGFLAAGLDVHGGAGGGPEGVRIEVPVGLEYDFLSDRVVVADRLGRDLGNGETPLTVFTGPYLGFWETAVFRSRLDPNGVMYVPYGTLDSAGVAAIRPAPLAPTWLSLEAWNGWVEPGGSAEVGLTFRAGARTPGVYRTTLVVEGTTGALLASVPLALEVRPGTAGEPEPAGDGRLTLSVVPNPVRDGRAEVTLALPEAGPATVAVYDPLGRRVAVLHEGPLGAGEHTFAWPAAGVAQGVYVVRLWAGGAAVARRVVLVR